MKRWLLTILSGLLFLVATPVTGWASTGSQAQSAIIQQSGYSSPTKNALNKVTVQTVSYHSGFRSRSYFGSHSYGGYGGYGAPSYGTSRFGASHLFSFGTGWLLGSLFHPFGGYYGGWGYGYAYYPFSIFHILFDLFILYVLWRIVRRLFFR